MKKVRETVKKSKGTITFNFTEKENGSLSNDIDRIIKKEQSEKFKSIEIFKNKEE